MAKAADEAANLAELRSKLVAATAAARKYQNENGLLLNKNKVLQSDNEHLLIEVRLLTAQKEKIAALSHRLLDEKAATQSVDVKKREELDARMKAISEDVTVKFDAISLESKKVYEENNLLRERNEALSRALESTQAHAAAETKMKALELQLAQASQQVAEAVAKEQTVAADSLRKLAEEALVKEGVARAECARTVAQVGELRANSEKYATAFEGYKAVMDKNTAALGESEKARAALQREGRDRDKAFRVLLDEHAGALKLLGTERAKLTQLTALCRTLQGERVQLRGQLTRAGAVLHAAVLGGPAASSTLRPPVATAPPVPDAAVGACSAAEGEGDSVEGSASSPVQPRRPGAGGLLPEAGAGAGGAFPSASFALSAGESLLPATAAAASYPAGSGSLWPRTASPPTGPRDDVRAGQQQRRGSASASSPPAAPHPAAASSPQLLLELVRSAVAEALAIISSDTSAPAATLLPPPTAAAASSPSSSSAAAAVVAATAAALPPAAASHGAVPSAAQAPPAPPPAEAHAAAASSDAAAAGEESASGSPTPPVTEAAARAAAADVSGSVLAADEAARRRTVDACVGGEAESSSNSGAFE